MAGSNGTTEDVSSFTYQQIFKLDIDAGPSTKTAVAVLTSLFFCVVNCVMLFALRSKRIFQETPRYILFGHMLMNDSVLLLVTTIMYRVALCFLPIPKSICTLLVFISHCTFRNAPLTLALMSLERYVAICFPLRHCNIATPKRTGIAIGFIWILSSINFVTDIILVLVLDPSYLTGFIFCTLEKLFLFRWQLDKYQAFDVLYFVSVAVIIIFTYISIMITARSVSSDKDSAKKALKTVLLHLIQLGLCLTSFLYTIIERTLYLMTGSNSSLFINLRYLNYLIVLILPRCLSPLIYGMRDEAVWPLFKYFFCYRSGKVKPTTSCFIIFILFITSNLVHT
uniref:Olfactory receptor 2M3-like n=1 Tax=Cyprinus carpio TaxID=7962 RepID=A0A8C1QCQ5_CYPCA